MQRETRRSFFKKVMMGVALAPILKATDLYAKVAASCPQGEPTDAKVKKKLATEAKFGKSKAFVVDATKSKDKKYTKGAACGNCKYYNNKTDKDALWAKCPMLANSYVPSCGWCKLYKKV